MNKNPGKFWIVVLVLGFIFQYLFWGQSTGINFSIFITLALAGGFFLLISSGFKPAKQSLWLVFIFLFFIVITFSRQEPLTLFLAFTFTFFSTGVLVVT
jgi:hypothetical protein